MDTNTRKTREWTEAHLRDVVGTSKSWRDVLRALGYSPTSGAAKERIRRSVAEWGLSTAHFTRQRRWSDTDLARAVAGASNWSEVLEALSISSGRAHGRATVKSHALRLGIDISGLEPEAPKPVRSLLDTPLRLDRLRAAAESLAAAWFQLRGCVVFTPAGQERYDLLVDSPEGFRKVQVKSSTHRDKYGSYQAVVAPVRTHGENRNVAVPYDSGDVDLFFIVDGHGWMYLVPLNVIGGRCKISLNAYAAYRCGNAKGFLEFDDGGTAVDAAA